MRWRVFDHAAHLGGVLFGASVVNTNDTCHFNAVAAKLTLLKRSQPYLHRRKTTYFGFARNS